MSNRFSSEESSKTTDAYKNTNSKTKTTSKPSVDEYEKYIQTNHYNKSTENQLIESYTVTTYKPTTIENKNLNSYSSPKVTKTETILKQNKIDNLKMTSKYFTKKSDEETKTFFNENMYAKTSRKSTEKV